MWDKEWEAWTILRKLLYNHWEYSIQVKLLQTGYKKSLYYISLLTCHRPKKYHKTSIGTPRTTQIVQAISVSHIFNVYKIKKAPEI